MAAGKNQRNSSLSSGNETVCGVLPDTELKALFDEGLIAAQTPLDRDQIQPASIDLRLGDKAYRMRRQFSAGAGTTCRCLAGRGSGHA